MNSPQSIDENAQIIAVISQYPDGVAIQRILDELKLSSSRRTLLRRLTTLVDKGRLEKIGIGKGTRYRLVDIFLSSTNNIQHETLARTDAANQVLEYVSQEITKRKPANYQKSFLEQYTPNESFYLDPSLRTHLKEIGTQPDGEHPAGTFARDILDRLLTDLSWNSSRLEGNTYSLLETQKLILFDSVPENKNPFDTQMVLNHKKAIAFMVDFAVEINFNNITICNLHAFLSNNLLANPNSIGRLRSIPVGIGKTTYQPIAIPQLIAECFDTILHKARAINDPFEQAFFVMVHLPYLQPFEDVNKRVSRLAANISLIKNNLSPLSFVDVSTQSYINGILGVYELNKVELLRDVFVWAYERSAYRYSEIRQTLGEPDAFKMKHAESIEVCIKHIVSNQLGKTSATHYLQKWAAMNIDKQDQARFVGGIEEELLALQPGNIFRFGVTKDQFDLWNKEWSKK